MGRSVEVGRDFVGNNYFGDNPKIEQNFTQVSLPRAILAITAAVIVGAATVVFVVLSRTSGGSPNATLDAPSTTTRPSPNATPVVEVPQWSPLQVAYVTPLSLNEGDEHIVLPNPLGVAPAALYRPGGWDLSGLRERFNGVPAGLGITKFTVQNTTNQTIRIVDMNVVKDCGNPYTGTYIGGFSQGAPNPSLDLGINLDNPNPVVQAVDDPQTFTNFRTYFVGQVPLHGSDYFAANTVSIDAGDMQSFTIGAFTEHYSCTFKIRLVVAVIGHPTVYVDIAPPGDQSFRITAPIIKDGNGNTAWSGYDVAYLLQPDYSWSRVVRN